MYIECILEISAGVFLNKQIKKKITEDQLQHLEIYIKENKILLLITFTVKSR